MVSTKHAFFFCKPFDDSNAFVVRILAFNLLEAFTIYTKDWHRKSVSIHFYLRAQEIGVNSFLSSQIADPR